MELKELLVEIAKEKLATVPLYQRIVNIFETVQADVIALQGKADEKQLTKLKVGTILMLSVFKKAIDEKKRPKDYKAEDWKEIANDVSQYAILPDGQQYSIFVFDLYSAYIRTSADALKNHLSRETYSEITALADELDTLKGDTENGNIAEVKYIEQCLWTSLDAMLKLLAALPEVLGADEDKIELSKAVAMFALERTRLALYQRENEQLDMYLVEQAMLDGTLEEKYVAFAEQLEQEYCSFNSLLQNAFSPDFRDRLINSAELARAVGVPEDEILKSEEDIDDYFM